MQLTQPITMAGIALRAIRNHNLTKSRFVTIAAQPESAPYPYTLAKFYRKRHTLIRVRCTLHHTFMP